MKKICVLILVALCCSFSGCLPADSIHNEDYFEEVSATTESDGVFTYDIAKFGNTDEEDIPFARYKLLTLKPNTSIFEDIISLWHKKKMIGFACMIQAEEACTVNVKLIGFDWTKVLSMEDTEMNFGEQTIELTEREKYCYYQGFEYSMSNIGDAEEDEEFSELDPEEKLRKIAERISIFLSIYIDAKNLNGETVNIRLDSFIFRIIEV